MSTHLLFHSSYKALAQDAKQLVDEYKAKQCTEEELMEVLQAWDNNCPNLLYANGNRTIISPSILRYLGTRRATVILSALAAKRAQSMPNI